MMGTAKFFRVRLPRAVLTSGLVGAFVLSTGLLMTSAAWAVPLVPSANQLAVGEPDPTGGIVVASLSAPFVAGTYSGTLISQVISGDPSNPLGGLTFTYLLSNNPGSINAMERLTVTRYAGWGTDVSYQTPVPAGHLAPTTNDRDATGDVMGFSFSNPVFVGPPLGTIGNGVLSAGKTSALLVIQTNAPSYQPTIANVIDGSVTALNSYAPATSIPEPATMGLALMGAVGVALAMRRTRCQ